jgi:hypothetical protein
MVPPMSALRQSARSLLLVLLAASVPAFAQETNRPARPPRVYGGQVQMHQVPLGASQLVPEPEARHTAPAMPGGHTEEPLKAQPLVAPPPPRVQLDQRSEEEKARDEERSGWGWLADDIFSARARKAEENLEEVDEAREVSRRPEQAGRAWEPEEQDGEEEAAPSATNQSAREARQRRGDDAYAARPGERPAEGSLRWGPAEERWSPASTMWDEREAPDMGLSVTGDISSWDVTKPVEVPREALLAPVQVELSSSDARARMEADRAAQAVRETAADHADPGALRPSAAERVSPFAPSVSASDVSLGAPVGWGGSDLGAAIGPVSLPPVQASLTPAPVSSPSLQLPSASEATPALGEMGGSHEQARPKTLPW